MEHSTFQDHHSIVGFWSSVFSRCSMFGVSKKMEIILLNCVSNFRQVTECFCSCLSAKLGGQKLSSTLQDCGERQVRVLENSLKSSNYHFIVVSLIGFIFPFVCLTHCYFKFVIIALVGNKRPYNVYRYYHCCF